MKLLIVGVLAYIILAGVTAEEPECPLLECLTGSKVACFLTEERCRCFCVPREPCEFLRETFSEECKPPNALQCSTEGITCKCHC
ncbi:hypothetical protein V5799_020744, partial [Amblyomma americanum]